MNPLFPTKDTLHVVMDRTTGCPHVELFIERRLKEDPSADAWKVWCVATTYESGVETVDKYNKPEATYDFRLTIRWWQMWATSNTAGIFEFCNRENVAVIYPTVAAGTVRTSE